MEIYLIANRLMVAFSLARVCEVDGTLPACVGFPSSIATGDAGGFTQGITIRKPDCHGLLRSVQPCIHKLGYFYLSIYLYPSFFCICGDCAAAARLCAEQEGSQPPLLSYPPSQLQTLPGKISRNSFTKFSSLTCPAQVKFSDSQLKSQ